MKNMQSQANICQHFKMNRCKFGSSGRKGGKCENFHPKKCYFYMFYGPWSKKNPDGCNLEKCTDYHPALCHQSLKSKTCNREQCTYSHLVGTVKRKSSDADKLCEKIERSSTSKNLSHKNHKQNASRSDKGKHDHARSSTPERKDEEKTFLEMSEQVMKQMRLEFGMWMHNLKQVMQPSPHQVQGAPHEPQGYWRYHHGNPPSSTQIVGQC